MNGRQLSYHAAPAFLRERARQVVGAQSGFNVADGDLSRERCQGARRRGRGVALDQHHIGPQFAEHGVQPIHDLGEAAAQRAFTLGLFQADVGADAQNLQRLSVQRGLLLRRPPDGIQPGRRQGGAHRRHLHYLGPRARNDRDLHLLSPSAGEIRPSGGRRSPLSRNSQNRRARKLTTPLSGVHVEMIQLLIAFYGAERGYGGPMPTISGNFTPQSGNSHRPFRDRPLWAGRWAAMEAHSHDRR